jgi:hypothetical protein
MKINPRFLRSTLGFSALAILLAAPLRADIVLQPDEKGILVKNDNILFQTISYPELMSAKAEIAHKITGTTHTDTGATITYDGGATCSVSIASGAIIFSFANVPSDAQAWKCTSLIDAAYRKGGSWKMGGGPAKPFPADPPTGDAHFFSASSDSFQLTDANGNSVIFRFPPYSYGEVQDNRKWGWDIYAWMVSDAFSPDTTEYRLTVEKGTAPTVDAAAAAPAPASP